MAHISRRHGDDYYSENLEWTDDLPDIGESAGMAYKHSSDVIAPDPYTGDKSRDPDAIPHFQ